MPSPFSELASAKVNNSGAKPAPHGEYVVDVKSYKLFRTRSGKEMLEIAFIVADGELAGRDYNTTENFSAEGITYMKTTLCAILGVQAHEREKVDQVGRALEAIMLAETTGVAQDGPGGVKIQPGTACRRARISVTPNEKKPEYPKVRWSPV